MKTLGRTKDQRDLLLINLSKSLVLAEKIITTKAKATAFRPRVENWITVAKRASASPKDKRLAITRKLYQEIGDRAVVNKLVTDLAIRTQTRAGGYTRAIKLGTRVGDSAPVVVVELVDKPKPTPKEKSAKTIKETSKAKS